MNDIIKQHGLGFFGYILWRLNDQMVRAYADWAGEAGFQAPPRTHSTMLALRERGPLAVTEIAALIEQSHQLIITWIRQLKELGFVETLVDPNDGRRTLVSLTRAGRAEAERHDEVRAVIAKAIERLMTEADADVFEPLWRIEEALRRQPFLNRLQQASARDQGA